MAGGGTLWMTETGIVIDEIIGETTGGMTGGTETETITEDEERTAPGNGWTIELCQRIEF